MTWFEDALVTVAKKELGHRATDAITRSENFVDFLRLLLYLSLLPCLLAAICI